MVDAECRFGRQPDTGFMLLWEITKRCNLACAHCCTNSSPEVDIRGELSDDQVFQTIEEFASLNVREVMFTGGEPFLRTKIADFSRRAASHGVEVYLATNGTMLTADLANELQSCRIKRIDISLDGVRDELHRSVRLHPTSFRRTIVGIENCVKANLPLRVSTMLTEENLPEFYDLVEYLVNLGVSSLVVSSIQGGSGRAVSFPLLHGSRLQQNSVRQMVTSAIDRFGDRIKIDCRILSAHSSAPQGCPAGQSVLHIAPNGDVSPCSWLYKLNSARFRLGSLHNSSLENCIGNHKAMLQPARSMTAGCLIPYAHSS
jgi:MoaA/NifB/PqqE/SkfB family radical SAM enzyme